MRLFPLDCMLIATLLDLDERDPEDSAALRRQMWRDQDRYTEEERTEIVDEFNELMLTIHPWWDSV